MCANRFSRLNDLKDVGYSHLNLVPEVLMSHVTPEAEHSIAWIPARHNDICERVPQMSIRLNPK